MALSVELTSRLDTSGVQTTFAGEAGQISAELDGIAIPAQSEQISGATASVERVDLAGVLPAVTQAVGQIQGLLSTFPPTAALVEPLGWILDTLALLSSANIEQQLQGLAERLAGEFGGDARADFLAVLEQFGNAFGGATELRVLRELLQALLATAGVDLPAENTQLPNLPAAIAALARVLGGMMCLESVLSEAARLGAITAAQLDPAELQRRIDNAMASFSRPGFTLAALLAATDVTNAVQVDAARQALALCGRSLEALLDYCEQSMGFGEATVVYLNPQQLEVETGLAASWVRDTDLLPLETALQQLTQRIAPLLHVDLSGIPAKTLEQVLTEVEARVAALAEGIRTFDTTRLSAPVADVVGMLAELPNRLTDAIQEVQLAVQGALNQVRDAVAALPLDVVGNALRQVLAPIAEALATIGALIAAIEAALGTAVAALQAALNHTEQAVDTLQQGMEDAFKGATDFLRGLNLDQVVGDIAAKVQEFATLIGQAQMKPYFDTVIDGIDTATGVIEKVPFSLLPDSMESEVVAVLRPIKETDVSAIQHDIEDILQIGPDGKFALRPEVEAAIKSVQDKYDQLLDQLRLLDPQSLVAQLDEELQSLAEKIRHISPNVDLQPLQEALTQLRAVVASFDLDQALQPLRDGFDQLLEVVDRYAPGQLVTPLETQLDTVRETLVQAVRLRDWSARLDEIEQYAASLIDLVDPTNLEDRIAAGLQEAQQTLDRTPQVRIGAFAGSLLQTMIAGHGLRANPLAFEVVIDWLSGVSGTAALALHSRRFADGIKAARQAVLAFDARQLAAQLLPLMAAARSAVQGWPAGDVRTAFLGMLERIDPAARLANIATNAERYLALLTTTEGFAERLSRIGFSEVDVASARLQVAVAPLGALGRVLGDFLALLGANWLHLGAGEFFRRLLAVASPQRLAALATPIFVAFREKILAFLNAFLTPLRTSINNVLGLIDALDLTPLREGLDSIHQAARAEIAALHPDHILGEVLTAFRAVQQQVTEFDPLAALTNALTALRNTVARVLEKLHVGKILAAPIALYEEIVGLLGQLDIQQLLAPVLDQLDAIAAQVEQGLDDTVAAFERLQEALPEQVGSTPLSASVSVNTA